MEIGPVRYADQSRSDSLDKKLYRGGGLRHRHDLATRSRAQGTPHGQTDRVLDSPRGSIQKQDMDLARMEAARCHCREGRVDGRFVLALRREVNVIGYAASLKRNRRVGSEHGCKPRVVGSTVDPFHMTIRPECTAIDDNVFG